MSNKSFRVKILNSNIRTVVSGYGSKVTLTDSCFVTEREWMEESLRDPTDPVMGTSLKRSSGKMVCAKSSLEMIDMTLCSPAEENSDYEPGDDVWAVSVVFNSDSLQYNFEDKELADLFYDTLVEWRFGEIQPAK